MAVLISLFGLHISIFAQGPGSRNSEAFDASPPKMGEMIPNVSAYDSSGEDIELRDHLNGTYTVLVFGCLT